MLKRWNIKNGNTWRRVEEETSRSGGKKSKPISSMINELDGIYYKSIIQTSTKLLRFMEGRKSLWRHPRVIVLTPNFHADLSFI